MGWKSTLKLSREDAISAIIREIYIINNEELGYIMGDMFGDDTEKQYFGHNFWIVDNIDNEI